MCPYAYLRDSLRSALGDSFTRAQYDSLRSVSVPKLPAFSTLQKADIVYPVAWESFLADVDTDDFTPVYGTRYFYSVCNGYRVDREEYNSRHFGTVETVAYFDSLDEANEWAYIHRDRENGVFMVVRYNKR